jgi:hypothetical protein
MDPAEPERRRHSRHRTLLGAKICYGDQHALSLDCTVRSLSATGANLRVAETRPLPAQFVLLIVGEAAAYDARIVWRRGDFVGVSLGEAMDMRPPVVEERLKAVRRLWAALAPL